MTSPIKRPSSCRALLTLVLTAAAVMAVGCGSSDRTPAGGAAQRSAATSVLLTFEAEPSPQAPAIDSTVSGSGQALNQHFAFSLDTQLLTVPQVDFKTYPNGIPGESGAAIFGAFTRTSAQELAAELRLGPLPVQLRLLTINGRRTASSG